MLFLFRSLFVVAVLLGSSSCHTPPAKSPPPSAAAAPVEPSTPALAALTYNGSQDAVAALDREIVQAGLDRAQLSAIAHRLVALLSSADATFAARQAVAQRLGLLLADSLAPEVAQGAQAALGAMLVNDLQVDLARLALEPVPGAAIDRVFLDGLAAASGRKRLAIVQSLGARRVEAAVPALATLQRDPDRRLASAATKALGEIGGPAAAAALRAGAEINPIERNAALLAAASRLPAHEATAIYLAIKDEGGLPHYLRAAATRGWLAADPTAAARRVVEILSAAAWEEKEVALETIGILPAGEIVPALASVLGTFDSPTQVAVIAAFGRHAHAAATEAVTNAVGHSDVEVRTAAVTALGLLPGGPAAAKLLAETIVNDAAIARSARQSLARLSGPGVAATILAGAQNGSPATRAIFIEQLVLRYATEALPTLLALRGDPAPTVRNAALAAIGELGGASEQAALLDSAINAQDATEQSRALRAFVTLTLRLPNVDTRGEPLFTAIEQAAPPLCVRLMPALPRLGGAASAACAARLALRDDPVVAEAAANTLARWPDRKCLFPLVEVAEKTNDPSRRHTAERTAVQWLERNREAWSTELSGILARLSAAASSDDVQLRLLAVLRRGNDDDALALAEKLRAQPSIAAAAEETALTIRANLAGPPTFRASTSTGSLRHLMDNRPATFWSAPATPEHWLEMDFKHPRPLHRITLSHGDRAEDIPERYDLFVTDQLEAPGAPRASGVGQRGATIIDLPPGTRGRYVIIKHTAERRESSWAVAELFVE